MLISYFWTWQTTYLKLDVLLFPGSVRALKNFSLPVKFKTKIPYTRDLLTTQGMGIVTLKATLHPIDEVLLKRGRTSPTQFMFEYTDPSLQGEVYSNMNLGVLELRLHKVHFGDKFSEAELARRRRPCLPSAISAVSTPMSTRRSPSTPMPSLQGKGL